MPTEKANADALRRIEQAKQRRDPLLDVIAKHEELFQAVGHDLKNLFEYLDQLERRVILLEAKYMESIQEKGKIG